MKREQEEATNKGIKFLGSDPLGKIPKLCEVDHEQLEFESAIKKWVCKECGRLYAYREPKTFKPSDTKRNIVIADVGFDEEGASSYPGQERGSAGGILEQTKKGALAPRKHLNMRERDRPRYNPDDAELIGHGYQIVESTEKVSDDATGRYTVKRGL